MSGETNGIVKVVNGPVDDTAAMQRRVPPLAPVAFPPPLFTTGDSTLFRTVRLSKGFPRLQFVLEDTSAVAIEVVNQDGDVIRDLLDRSLAPGEYHAIWNGRNSHGHIVPDGLYSGHLSVNGELTASILDWRLERAE